MPAVTRAPPAQVLRVCEIEHQSLCSWIRHGTNALGFRLRANASEGKERFPISHRKIATRNEDPNLASMDSKTRNEMTRQLKTLGIDTRDNKGPVLVKLTNL